MAFDGTLKFDTAIDKTGFKLGIDNLGNIAKSGMSLITGAIGAASGAVTALGGYAVKVGKEFESGMSQIGATLGYSVTELHDETSEAHENMEKLTAKAEEMGRKTAFSASQAADGLNILAMSGFDASTSIDMVENVLNLAAAGGLSLAQSASYVSGSMKGFVAEAANFADATEASAYYSDMIAKGATLANTNVSQLGEALSQASAAANSYGQTSAATEVALLRLAEQNVTGTAAATALSAAMKNIYSPMEQAKKVMDELGVSAYTSAGEARDFNQVVNELNDALSTKTAEERSSLESAIFGIQGKDAFDKMVSTSAEKTQKFYDSLEYTDNGSMGSAALQAETMLDNLEGRITLFQSASEGFANAIYKNLQDPLKELVEIGTDYVSELTESLESGDFSGLAESLGSVLADAVTTLSGYIPLIVDIGASLIQSLISGLSDNAPQIIDTLVSTLKTLTVSIFDIAENFLSLGKIVITEFSSGILTALPDIADSAVSLIFALIDTFSELLPELIPIAAEIIQTLADSLAENIPVFTEKLAVLTSEIIENLTSSDFLMTILNLGISIIKSLADGIISAIPVIIEALPAITENIVNFVMEALPALLNAGAEIITALISGITENAGYVGNTAVEIIGFLINSLSENLPLIINSALGLMYAVQTGIIENLSVLADAASEIIKKFAECLAENAPLLLDAAAEIIMSFLDFTIQNLPALTEISIGMIMQILNGITANLPKIAESAVKLVQSLISGIISALPQIISATFQLVEIIWNTITETDWLALGVEILMGIINGIAGELAVIYIAVEDFLTEISDSVSEYFSIGISEISGFFSDIWSSVKDFFSDIVESAKNGASEFVENITEFFSQLPYKIGFWIGETLGNIVQWAIEMCENAQKTASEFVENINTFFSELPEKVDNWLASAIEKVAEWSSDLIEKGKNAASEFLENIVDFIKKLPSKAKEHLDTTIENVKKFGTDLWTKGKEAAEELVKKITSTIEDLPQKMADSGRNLVEGLWNGITGAGEWLKSKISEFGSGIIDGFKESFGIHSPSTVMRDSVGKFLAQGIGVGFTDEMSSVGNDVTQAFSEVVDSLETDIPKPEIPDFNVPEIAFEKPEIPDFDVPEITFETPEIPDFDIPEIAFEKPEIPDFDVPKIEPEQLEIEIIMPDIKALKMLVDIAYSDLKIPKIRAELPENIGYDNNVAETLDTLTGTMNSGFYQPSPTSEITNNYNYSTVKNTDNSPKNTTINAYLVLDKEVIAEGVADVVAEKVDDLQGVTVRMKKRGVAR